MQPLPGPAGFKEQGKPSRSQAKGGSQQQPVAQGSTGQQRQPSATENSRASQANDHHASKISASSQPKTNHVAQGGIASIFTNGNSNHAPNPSPAAPGGDWDTKAKPALPSTYLNPPAPTSLPHPSVTISASAANPAKQQQQQQSAPFHPLLSSMFDQHRSRTLESVQTKFDDLCKKRSDLDQEVKILLESISEEAKQQKSMRDKVEVLEKEVVSERSKREALELEVKALTKQRQDELSNRERMQEEEAAESQRRFDAAQAAHDQALSEIQSKCDHYEHLLNNAQAELEQYQQQQLQQVHLHQMAIAQQQQLGSQGGFPPLLQGGMNGYIPPYMMGAPHQAQGFTNPQGQGGPFMHQDPTQAFQQHPGSFTGFNSNLMDMTSTMMHGGPPPGFSHPQYPPPHQYPPSMMTQDPGQVLPHPGQGLGLGSGYGNNPNDLNNPPHSHSTMMMMATANVGGAGPFGNPPGFNGPQGGQVNPPRVQEARADRSTLVPTLNPSLMGPSSSDQVVNNPHMSPVSSNIKGNEGRAPGSPLPLPLPQNIPPPNQEQPPSSFPASIKPGGGSGSGSGFGAGFGEGSEDSSAPPPSHKERGGQRGGSGGINRSTGQDPLVNKGKGHARRVSAERAPQPQPQPQISNPPPATSGGGVVSQQGGGRGQGGQEGGLPPKAEGGRGRGRGRGG